MEIKGAEYWWGTAGYATRAPADIKRVLGVTSTSFSHCFPLCSKHLFVFFFHPLLPAPGQQHKEWLQRTVDRKTAVAF